MTDHILTLNAGSSSIKFALFTAADQQELIRWQVEGIGGAVSIEAVLAGCVRLTRRSPPKIIGRRCTPFWCN